LRIDLLYYEDCPSHEDALQRLKKVMLEEGIEAEVEVTKVETGEQAQELQFVGSPTIRIDGGDVVSPSPEEPYVLTCRAYALEDGRISPLPSEATIRSALRESS
jgi:hypothetical protein